jgi:fumarate reductase flavoprotein subunit
MKLSGYVLCFLLSLLCFSCASGGTELRALYVPGVYEGMGEGYFGPVIVEVEVGSDAIIQVDVLQYSDTPGIGTQAFEELAGAVVDANSSDVDIVSGASYSSRGFLDAVEDALQKAALTQSE